ncbi:MAG: hypothetical protein AAF517_11370 [Planctomycetota bacterium]
MRFRDTSLQRQRGNALLGALAVLTVLGGFAAAQVVMQQKQVVAAKFYKNRAQLQQYVESGIAQAIHDLKNEITGTDGSIGVSAWDTASDLGADGVAGTGDIGEGDGIPTVGEAGIIPVSVGPATANIKFFAAVLDTADSSVKHIVATAYDSDSEVTIEKYVRKDSISIPRVGSFWLNPTSLISVSDPSQFYISGFDHDEFGDPTGINTDALYGLSTTSGDVVGVSVGTLFSQLSSDLQSKITGLGTTPSMSEFADVDPQPLVDKFTKAATDVYSAGTYNALDVGNVAGDDLRIVHVTGDLTIDGSSSGAGVLVVNGDMSLSDRFVFDGLVIVMGDLFLLDGADLEIVGALMVNESISTPASGSTTMAPAPWTRALAAVDLDEVGLAFTVAKGGKNCSTSPGSGKSGSSSKSCAPSGKSSAPSGKSCAPSGKSSAPSGKSCAPSGKSSAPSGKSCAPSGKSSAPSGKSCAPSGKSCGPPGKSSVPTGKSSAPSGKSPAPSGKSGPSGPSLKGGPSGPSLKGGPSGPSIMGGPSGGGGSSGGSSGPNVRVDLRYSGDLLDRIEIRYNEQKPYFGGTFLAK